MPETRCLKNFNKKLGLVENCYFSTYPFRLSDFCVNEILNKSEVKLKIMIAFTIGCLCKFDFCVLSIFLIFLSNHGSSLSSKIIFLFEIKLLMIFRRVSLNSDTWSLVHLCESFLSQSKGSMAFVMTSLLALSYSHTPCS